MNTISRAARVKTVMIVFFVLMQICVGSCMAFTDGEIAALKAKAGEAQAQLALALEEGKDVSQVVPKMKHVKVLGDAGKLPQADALLEEILDDFIELQRAPSTQAGQFVNPSRVEIVGNPYDAMEPFITRDGSILFFNSSEADTPKSQKNIYYATRVDATTFKFMGEVKGINSAKVDGVPSMDNHGNFYFVSTANYNRENRYASVYRGEFKDGVVRGVTIVPELSLNEPGWVNMDIEISADGKTIYATQTFFGGSPPPKKSYFFAAHLHNGKFSIDPRSSEIFGAINTEDLEYAASISTDQREIFFTRLTSSAGMRFSTYYATRSNQSEVFGEPVKIAAITGFSEGPAVTDDGSLVYFHKKSGGRFYIYVLQRTDVLGQ